MFLNLLACASQPADPAFDLVDKVNTFYSDAMGNLLWVIGGAFAAIGIVMPLVLQKLQNRTFDRAEKDLDTKLAKAEQDLRLRIDGVRDEAVGLVKGVADVFAKSMQRDRDLAFSYITFLAADMTVDPVGKAQRLTQALVAGLDAAVADPPPGARMDELIGVLHAHGPLICEQEFGPLHEATADLLARLNTSEVARKWEYRLHKSYSNAVATAGLMPTGDALDDAAAETQEGEA